MKLAMKLAMKLTMKLTLKLMKRLTKRLTKQLAKRPTKQLAKQLNARAPVPLPSRPRPGFSIVELMVVLAIAAILAALALPNLGMLVRAQHLKVAVNDLFGSIGMTRAQALARNARVQLSPRDPAGADWSRGWTVFVDRNDDGVPGAGDEILSEHPALADGIAIRFAFSSAAAPFYIAYNGAGRSTSNTSDAARFGTVSLFQEGAIRRIKINMLGRARVCDPARDDSCEGADAP